MRALGIVIKPVIERLEQRCLMYGNLSTVEPLPVTLDFNQDNGGVVDSAGVGTGFTFIQQNKNTNVATSSFPEYNPALISIPRNPDNTFKGILNLTTTGNATNGGPYEGDNTLVNNLETTFDATTGAFTITASLVGPLTNIKDASDQGGIMFGPDQDNYIKLVAAAQPSPNNQVIQFMDEAKSGSTFTHTYATASTYTNVGAFSAITSLDLRISGDPTTGKIIGFYRINGGSYIKLSQEFNYTGTTASSFFSPTARAGLIAMAKNNLAPITVSFDKFSIEQGTPASQRPSVNGSTPVNGATGIFRDASIEGTVVLPTAGAGIDANTLTANTVMLTRVSDGFHVPATLNTDGAGGVIILHPLSALDPSTQYQFTVNAGLLDTNGASFIPFSSTFTTGTTVQFPTPTQVAFQQVDLPTTAGQQYTCVKFGPDGLLYASTLQGLIQRFTVNPDGTLSSPTSITTIQSHAGGNREVTGFAFDPASTASNLMMYVTNSQYSSFGAADWTGKITLLSGPALQNYQDYVVGLPRSIKDHQTEIPSFGPDGFLYVEQGSNTAMGAPDNAWGLRPEDLLSAAILRVDIKGIATRITQGKGAGLNVQTAGLPSGQSAYDPFAAVRCSRFTPPVSATRTTSSGMTTAIFTPRPTAPPPMAMCRRHRPISPLFPAAPIKTPARVPLTPARPSRLVSATR